jgi:hypothetical protein
MSVEQMRAYLLQLYSKADKWQRKVRAMSDRQVAATYRRLISPKKVK